MGDQPCISEVHCKVVQIVPWYLELLPSISIWKGADVTPVGIGVGSIPPAIANIKKLIPLLLIFKI